MKIIKKHKLKQVNNKIVVNYYMSSNVYLSTIVV